MDRACHPGALGLKVTVDPNSGFCYGVVRAVAEAERYLAQAAPLYSLGAIVHNNEELERLCRKGLRIVDPERLSTLSGQTVIIRAHGEPPSTYEEAQKQRLNVIDCTCPVVLKLQQKIKEEFHRIRPMNGQIAIFGKSGHAEVNGLIGQVDGDAKIIECGDQTGLLDYNRPVSLFAQTTQDSSAFLRLCCHIETHYRRRGITPARYFRAFNTVCKQVSERGAVLRAFAKRLHTLVFVSGKESSNGKVLFDVCAGANPRSFRVENSRELCREWFSAGTTVGICGATSTPKWLMEEVASIIRTF